MNITNAVRILKSKKIDFEVIEYKEEQTFSDGMEILNYIKEDPKQIFKTIVLTNKKNYFVVMVGIAEEINLKKCAKEFGEKSLELLPLANLTTVTGYIRGGCSPIGMKKSFKTIVDIDALAYDYIYFSAGRIGMQIKMNPNDLSKVINVEFKNIKR
ncbi:MAG: Cys-tRNA(Pro) deacylase [Acholeplasmatales bacterium]|nr:Cys-tRNA(Pro) deacylase [Acholeplasmatales bacterium]